MAGVNKVILLGNLGADPEVKTLESGKKVANFNLATSETYKNKSGEKVTNTTWHSVVLWGPLAEIAERYLTKGGQVYIEGKIATRSYDDKDGNKRYVTEVIGNNINLIGGRAEHGQDKIETNHPDVARRDGQGTPEEDDLPF